MASLLEMQAKAYFEWKHDNNVHDFIGSQFWEAGKTLKVLAEEQYFNNDENNAENPVKVC